MDVVNACAWSIYTTQSVLIADRRDIQYFESRRLFRVDPVRLKHAYGVLRGASDSRMTPERDHPEPVEQRIEQRIKQR